MVMRRLRDGFGGVMMVRSRHRRVVRVSRVFCADSLAHVAGKGSPDDHESECERQQASSHLSPVYRTQRGRHSKLAGLGFYCDTAVTS